MSRPEQFDEAERRRIYEYVERNGAVKPETIRQNVLVQPETASKPARSGSDLEPSVMMPSEEFNHHVSILKRDGFLEEHDEKLRVVLPMDEDAITVEIDGLEATVRPARQEDITGIIGVIKTVASVDTYVVAARLADKIDRDQVLLRHNETEDRIFFVVTVDNDTIGWLHIEAEQFPKMDHTAKLTMGVLDQYRSHGLGSILMEQGIKWTQTQGYRKLYQNLPATNERAISFLEDHGWSVESTHDGHYLIDDELVDEVQLAIWLDE